MLARGDQDFGVLFIYENSFDEQPFKPHLKTIEK